ncbi:MAG: helix-turn-helix domain-containing protein [Blautia sp.]|jgi:DNA-binding Xre family transcriptional regulator
MTREEYIKELIHQHNLTLKKFAQQINIPYTTLLSILKNGLGGAAVDNVIKICRGLDITIEDLQKIIEDDSQDSPFYVNSHERAIISNYRNMPEMQPAIDTILNVHKENHT